MGCLRKEYQRVGYLTFSANVWWIYNNDKPRRPFSRPRPKRSGPPGGRRVVFPRVTVLNHSLFRAQMVCVAGLVWNLVCVQYRGIKELKKRVEVSHAASRAIFVLFFYSFSLSCAAHTFPGRDDEQIWPRDQVGSETLRLYGPLRLVIS